MKDQETFPIEGVSFVAPRFFENLFAKSAKHEFWLDTVYDTIFESKPGAYIDVGANLGQSLLKVLLRDSERQYIGFEPQLECVFYVDQFIAANNLNNHLIFPLALSSRQELTKLNLRTKKFNREDSGVASIISNFRPDSFYEATKFVCSVRGDEIIDSVSPDHIAMLKIDAEGAELEVVEGLKNTIQTYLPVVLFEVLSHFLLLTGQYLDEDTIAFRNQRLEALDKLLKSFGYRLFQCRREQGVMEVTRLGAETTPTHKNATHLALHTDYVEEFMQTFSVKSYPEPVL